MSGSKNGRLAPKPGFTFDPAGFWASPRVQCMTPDEGWLYLRLLSECWRKQGLADPEELLVLLKCAMRLPAGFAREAWTRTICAHFEDKNGRFWDPALYREAELARSARGLRKREGSSDA